MDLFYKRCVIVLIAMLTQNLVITLADNVTSEQETLSKVLTNFLKVPWINLNSSWADTESSTCRNDVAIVFKSAEIGEIWALQMLDATSKVPAGILIGNILELGMFDECVNVKSDSNSANIQGQHCIISLSMPAKFFGNPSEMMRAQRLNFYNPTTDVDLSLSLSVCVPSSCEIQDINGLVNASIQNLPDLTQFGVSVTQVSCSSPESSVELTLGAILTLSFFVIVLILLLGCTACDFVFRMRSYKGSIALKNAAEFSLYTNALKLLNTTSTRDKTSAIHGIRVLNMILIICGHRAMNVLFKPTINTLHTHKLTKTLLSTLLCTLFFINDSFFLTSGFLVAYLFLKRMRSGANFDLLKIYLHRYMRLTPSHAVVILFVVFILPYLASGPIWKRISEHSIVYCQKNWWANLLYVQNVVNSDEMCLLHSWFLAAEMQLFWLSPIILYPLHRWPKFGLGILSLFLMASFIVPTVPIVVNRWSAIFAAHKSLPILMTECIKIFPITYNRGLPYFVGILLGYEVLIKKRQMSKLLIAVNWILASLLTIFSVWIVHHIQPRVDDYNVVWEAMYVSVGRLSWSLALAWVIYACSQGYSGPVKTFLSLPVFLPLSRLSYGIYLVHFVLQVTITATQRSADYLTCFSVMYMIWDDLVFSTIIAFFLSVCFESPIIALEKILNSDRLRASNGDCSTTKQAGLSIAVEKYLNVTMKQDSYDLMIEIVTSKLNFWQTISDELNVMSELSSKTATEWSEIWKDWRSKSSKIEMEDVFQPECNWKSELQLQNGITALVKELTVFIAAEENDGFTTNASLENLDVELLELPLKPSHKHPE